MIIHALKRFLKISLLEIRRRFSGKAFMMETDITDRCNLNCAGCYHQHEEHDPEPGVEQWSEFFEQRYREGIRMVLLVGGEPAMRPEVIRRACRRFPIVDVITNGSLPLEGMPGLRIYLSIDGDEETHDRLRGKGSYRKALNNFGGDPRVIINTTLSDENFHCLESLLILSKKEGFRGVSCNIMTPLADQVQQGMPLMKRREEMIAHLKTLKKKYPGTLLLNQRMIRWYEYPDHRQRCYWRQNVQHFDSHFRPRYCFAKLDCSLCGCYAGASTTVRFPF